LPIGEVVENQTLLGVGFLGAHESVIDFCVALYIQNSKARAVAGAVLGNVCEVQHAQIAHALFEVGDLEVDVALALFGEFVLGVFGEVAVGAGDGNLLGKFDAELVRELVDLVLQLFLDLR